MKCLMLKRYSFVMWLLVLWCCSTGYIADFDLEVPISSLANSISAALYFPENLWQTSRGKNLATSRLYNNSLFCPMEALFWFPQGTKHEDGVSLYG